MMKIKLKILIILLFISFLPSIPVYAEDGYAWTQTSSPSKKWKDIDSSADGSVIVGVEYSPATAPLFLMSPGDTYLSTDGGLTWGVISGSLGKKNWTTVGVSNDGSKIISGDVMGYFQVSTTTGATWAALAPSPLVPSWNSITYSGDGSKVFLTSALLGVGSRLVFISQDSGLTWASTTPSAGYSGWDEITSSFDGSHVALTVNGGYIYTSSDGGSTWATSTAAGSRAWSSITSSADGLKLVATVNGGYIYTSSDGGSTWATSTAAGSRNWSAVSSSDNGLVVVAAVSTGYIYISQDGGSTWTVQTSAGSRTWSSITSSADGTKIAASVASGMIYTSLFDDTLPEIIDLATSTEPTIYTLSFSTNNNATSTLIYELNSGAGTSTETSFGSAHDYNLPNLISCTTYKYSLSIINSFFKSTSVSSTFTTQCPLGASAASTTQQIIATSTGGTISLDNLALHIPVSYATTTASFQMSKLDNIISPSESLPVGKTLIEGYSYSLSALVTSTTTISSFNSSLGLVFTYDPEDIPTNIDPTTLTVYRNDDSVWTELLCQVDTDSHTISCDTNHFSVFSIFGSAYPEASSSRNYGYKKVSLKKAEEVNNQPVSGDDQVSKNLSKQLTDIGQRDLEKGYIGADVLALQKFLNEKGFVLAASGIGSLGNETNYFGSLTQVALIKFQSANNILPAAGYFGPITRAFILKSQTN